MIAFPSRVRALERKIVELETKLVSSYMENMLMQHALREFAISKGTSSRQFSSDELRKLIQLCHPDKHGGSELAVKMTQRINEVRA